MIGEKLSNRYEILQKLGSGGMGDVYLAYDPVLERKVAIKLVKRALMDTVTQERFRREARVVAKMDHPSIVSVYDVGEYEGVLFIVMAYVPGKTLRFLLDNDLLNLKDIISITIQVAEALEYSHLHQVIHRDIKPENIMIMQEQTLRVRVMDFGLAITSNENRLTDSGTIIGTLSYFSPEQVTEKQIDSRSDIYSLATVLYECLARRLPFSGEGYVLLYEIAHRAPQPLQSLGVKVSQELEKVILQCLEKDPKNRPESVRDLIEALEKYLLALQNTSQVLPSAHFSLPSATAQAQITKFVGRVKELTELQQRLKVCSSGECQFVIIGGEAGIGKSRLLDELENIAKSDGITVLHGHFMEQDKIFAYQGFCEIIQEYFRLKTMATPSLISRFSDLITELPSLFPVLSEGLKIEVSSSHFSKLTTANNIASFTSANKIKQFDDKNNVFDLLARTLIRIAENNPLVILIEGLHGADVSIDALQYIVRRLSSTPILIVGTYRTTEISKGHPLTKMLRSFESDRHFALITLEPLSLSHYRNLLQSLTSNPKLEDDVINKLYEVTEGNPYFTKEIVLSLINSGAFVQDETGCFNPLNDLVLSSEILPTTVQQTIENRITQLPENLREILSIISILGKTFELRDLEMLFEDELDLDDAIEELLEYGLIEQQRKYRKECFSFSSGVVRDVVYKLLSRRKRKLLHKKYAENLEKRHSQRLERVYPQLIHHYSQADVASKVVDYALKLAKNSLNALNSKDALRAAKTALDFLEDQSEQLLEGEIRVLIAQAHRLTGNIKEALEELSSAIKIFEQEKQTSKVINTIITASEVAWEGRKVDQTMFWVEKGLKIAQAISHTSSLKKLFFLGATVANLRGEYERAKEFLEQADLLQLIEVDIEKELSREDKLAVILPNEIQAFHPSNINVNYTEIRKYTSSIVRKKEKAIIYVPFDREFESLDPSLAFCDIQGEVIPNVFETLTHQAEGARIIPWLASEFWAEEGSKRFHFRLRENVRFHDGRQLTARDVRYSFERLLQNQESQSRFLLSPILGAKALINGEKKELEGFHIISPTEFTIDLDQAVSFFPALLAYSASAIVPEATEQFQSNWQGGYVGTGPFRVLRFNPNHRLELEANPDYWRKDFPKSNGLVFMFKVSQSHILSGFQSGQFSLIGTLLPVGMDTLLNDSEFVSCYHEIPSFSTFFIAFNTKQGHLANQQLRRRIIQAINLNELICNNVGRHAIVAHSLIPPGLLGYEPVLSPISQPLEPLKQPIELSCAIPPSFLQGSYSKFYNSFFKALDDQGIKIEIVTKSWEEFLKYQASASVDLSITGWLADYPDADTFIYGVLHSEQGNVGRFCGSPEIDVLIEKGRTETNALVRHSIYREIEEIIESRALLLPLFHPQACRFARPEVEGFELNPFAPIVAYEKLWIR